MQALEEGSSSSSDELTKKVSSMSLADESYLLSPEICSTVSSSSEGQGEASTDVNRQRQKLNIFQEECGVQPLKAMWQEWDKISERTRQQYLQKTSEIVTSVLRIVSPENAVDLWKALQTSNNVNNMLGVSQTSLSSKAAYLEVLAEAYKSASSWDTRR